MTMTIQEFYKKFAALPKEKRNVLLREVRHDPLTPFLLYKEVEAIRMNIRNLQRKEEELLRIADETFDKITS
jgi:hypothetical protein